MRQYADWAGSKFTILNQDGKTLPDEQIVVEDNQAKREREDIVTGSDAEEVTHASLKEHDKAVSGFMFETDTRGSALGQGQVVSSQREPVNEGCGVVTAAGR